MAQLESKNDELVQLHCTINSLDEILLSYGVDMAGDKIESCNEVVDESFKDDLELDEKKIDLNIDESKSELKVDENKND